MSTEFYMVPSVPYATALEKLRAAGIHARPLDGFAPRSVLLTLKPDGPGLVMFEEPDASRRRDSIVAAVLEDLDLDEGEQIRVDGEAVLECFSTGLIEKLHLLVRAAEVLNVGVWSELGADMLDPEGWGPPMVFSKGSDYLRSLDPERLNLPRPTEKSS